MPKINSKSRITIFRAALRIARKPGGWASITRAAVAERAGCAESLVSHYYGTMEELREVLMDHAKEKGCADLLVQGVISGALGLDNLSETLREKVIAHLHSL